MRTHPRTTRSGAALLLTLVTLVLTLAAITGVAGLAASCKLDREFDRLGLMADDLLIAADEVILDWLREESAKVVLPPEARTPEVLVVHHLWQSRNLQPTQSHGGEDAIEMELRITAWDQCGMVPFTLAKAGSPLRLALPEHVLEAIDSFDSAGDDRLGLDAFAGPYDADSVSAFPLPAAVSDESGGVRIFGGSQTRGKAALLRSRGEGDQIERIAIGAFIGTHTEMMNLNTAPIAALEHAMREQGRGGIEVVVAARSAGNVVSLSSLPSLGGSHASSLRLAGTSDTWAFRIDARVGSVQRSWWAIYKPSQGRRRNVASASRTSGGGYSGGGGGGGWKFVQRMVIRD